MLLNSVINQAKPRCMTNVKKQSFVWWFVWLQSLCICTEYAILQKNLGFFPPFFFFFILVLWVFFVFFDSWSKKADSWEIFVESVFPMVFKLTWGTWKDGINPSRKEIKGNKYILKLLISWYQWGNRYFL